MTATKLPRRSLGKTGLQVSRLGLAALSMSAARKSLTPEEVERAYYELGVNTFLAHGLLKNVCEGVRRLIRAGHREDLVLVSAASLPFKGWVRHALEKNLEALGTDHLDVWLLGWLRKRWYVRDAVWSELKRLKEEGKVRALGYSSHDRVLAAQLARELPADVLMIRYNAAHRGAEREVFAPLAELGAERPGIISYTATRWGMLLRPLPKKGFSQAMSGPECYRFVLAHPAVDTAWCAPQSFAELEENVAGVLAGPLDAQRTQDVCRFGDAVHASAVGGFRWMFGSSAS